MKNSPEKKQKKLIRTGDVIELGDHRLVCGDATDKDVMEKLAKDLTIDCLLTDPPYGVSYTESKKDFAKLSNDTAIANDDLDDEAGYQKFTAAWLEALLPHLSKKNSLYIFNSDKMIFALREAMVGMNIHFAQLLIWTKTHSIIGRLDYLPQHELIAYGWYGTHQFEKSKDKSVLIHPKPNKSKLHPTMKPVGLLRRLVLNSTKVGDVVCDLFGGSGSTLIACEQTKRKCLMVESDPEYCQTTINRFEKLTGSKATIL
ncbi:MAG: site-specific DNA-methyltransferase [Candidatus Paceibacterota bacterium]